MTTANRATRLWTPSQYLRFGGERLRPALDLLAQARIALEDKSVERVIDLGCGTGNITPFLVETWPDSRIVSVDSSREMLDKVYAYNATIGKNVEYTKADFEGFHTDTKVDLIYSNAALHWVSFGVHEILIPKLLGYLNPGGVLAFQIPDTRSQPSHLLMREAAKQLGWMDRILETRWVTCDRDPIDYYKLLKPQATQINMWHSKYAMILEGENPVADFTASTGLGPYVDAFGGKDSVNGKLYIQKYRKLIADAYPKTEDGKTIFEFNRFFIVAKV
ncbi:UNVERIFIED_CONTAM: hypothetical protein HDU68_012920 [Siphonaria sp. JEL0065]|nr:hypothetical protein HDU68_012920 [Siphonaria sp. JEL0065]